MIFSRMSSFVGGFLLNCDGRRLEQAKYMNKSTTIKSID